MAKKKILFAIAAALLVLNIVLWKTMPIPQGPTHIKTVPSVSLPSFVGGEGIDNAILQQEEYALVYFFASWCVVCKKDHPILEKLRSEFDLPLYGIAWNDTEARVQEWVEKYGTLFDDIALDAKGHEAVMFGISGVPESFLMNKQGKILVYNKGPITPQQYVKIESVLNAATP